MTARFAGLLSALLAIALPAAAQAPAAFDAAARSAAIAKAADGLRTRYIFPDIGERAAKKIEAALAAGSYDTPGGPRAFAERVNADLYEVAKDKHLHIDAVGPPPARAPTGPPFSSEGGIVRADKLPGGVGYLEVNAFPAPDLFKPSTDRAMAALADSRALIIDVRRNTGGSPVSVSYLVSHFVQANARVHVNNFINRKAGTLEFSTEEFWTSPTPTSFAGKPVYLLTSSDTFSGGEELAYDMQALKLGTIIGEITSGGANPAGAFPIGADMAIVVPGGRALNPITQTNWEGVGVRPDILAPRREALKIALRQLGQPAAKTDISALSVARVFAPRTAPVPGAEEVIKTSAQGLISGVPRYDLMSPEIANLIRADAANTRDLMAPLGPLQSVTFLALNATGMDVYELKFANGRSVWSVGLNTEGKIVGLAPLRPATS